MRFPKIFVLTCLDTEGGFSDTPGSIYRSIFNCNYYWTIFTTGASFLTTGALRNVQEVCVLSGSDCVRFDCLINQAITILSAHDLVIILLSCITTAKGNTNQNDSMNVQE